MKENWPRHTDPLILGALAGVAGLLVRVPLELVYISFLPSFRSCARMGAGLIFPAARVFNDWRAYLGGVELDIFVVIVVGVMSVRLLQIGGLDHYLIKGAVGGGVTWIIFWATLSKPLSTLHPTGSWLEMNLSIASHLVFGLVVTRTAVAYDRRRGRARRDQSG